jgi:hypothetical protein
MGDHTEPAVKMAETVTEIEITPEMIEAVLTELAYRDDAEDWPEQ